MDEKDRQIRKIRKRLLGPAPGSEMKLGLFYVYSPRKDDRIRSQHILSGDWAAWKSASLLETGTLIEIDAIKPAEKQVEADPVADHTERKKTLSLPRKKTP